MKETKSIENHPEIILTLVVNGFHISKVQRYASSTIFNIYKFDKLGAEVRYTILFSDEVGETPLTETLLTFSRSYQSTPLIICDNKISDECRIYSKEEFFNLFSSFVNTGLILIPNLPEILKKLGLNSTPSGLSGDADDLLEIYAKECLQFILESPTKRFGQDRSFEKLPDGVVVAKQKFLILFDTKAYKDGFSFSSDDINRFASYVNDFNKRYASYLGRVFTFLVIAGKFNDSKESILNRSNELYNQCDCKLSCLTSNELGKIVELIKDNIGISAAVVWKNILKELIIDTKIVQKEIKRITKDNLI